MHCKLQGLIGQVSAVPVIQVDPQMRMNRFKRNLVSILHKSVSSIVSLFRLFSARPYCLTLITKKIWNKRRRGRRLEWVSSIGNAEEAHNDVMAECQAVGFKSSVCVSLCSPSPPMDTERQKLRHWSAAGQRWCCTKSQHESRVECLFVSSFSLCV